MVYLLREIVIREKRPVALQNLPLIYTNHQGRLPKKVKIINPGTLPLLIFQMIMASTAPINVPIVRVIVLDDKELILGKRKRLQWYIILPEKITTHGRTHPD